MSASPTTIRAGQINGPTSRALDEFDVFVRDDRALGILRKVLALGGESVNAILARDKEFGWTSNFSGFHVAKGEGDLPLYQSLYLPLVLSSSKPDPKDEDEPQPEIRARKRDPCPRPIY